MSEVRSVCEKDRQVVDMILIRVKGRNKGPCRRVIGNWKGRGEWSKRRDEITVKESLCEHWSIRGRVVRPIVKNDKKKYSWINTDGLLYNYINEQITKYQIEKVVWHFKYSRSWIKQKSDNIRIEGLVRIPTTSYLYTTYLFSYYPSLSTCFLLLL